MQNNPFPRTAGDKYNTILFRHICRASLWWDRSHNFLEFLLRNLSPNILHLHLSIIHLLDWTDDKTIFWRHIVCITIFKLKEYLASTLMPFLS